jgi:hypothetical protein
MAAGKLARTPSLRQAAATGPSAGKDMLVHQKGQKLGTGIIGKF